jgi:type VI secretion system protein ImpL
MKLPLIFQLIGSKLPRFKPSVTLLVILIAIASLIWLWIAGAEWKIAEYQPFLSLEIRLLITAFYIIIFCCWGFYIVIKKLQQYEEQQKDRKEKSKDPLKDDIRIQLRYLKHWLIKLKEHFNNSRDTVYQLPWYLMIGEPQSGKSTFLDEGYPSTLLYQPDLSEKEKPLITPLLGEQAVIFDVNGLLINQPNTDDLGKPKLYSRLWFAILNWLLKERSNQPLNGIIITIDLYNFVSSNKNRQDEILSNLHQRVSDIYKILQCKLPVYVVFTKLDLFYGFEAMYQKLDKHQRDSILGVTFDDEKKWDEELSTFWLNWGKQMNQAIPDMMLNSVDIQQRSALFSFSRQMHGIHDYLRYIINYLLLNQDKEMLILRGLYLVSSTQKGQMGDIFVKTTASQYHLNVQPYPTWPILQTQPYFSIRLFKDILLAEPNIAGYNLKSEQHHRRKIKLFSVIAAMCSISLIATCHYYYKRNYDAGDLVLAQMKQYIKIPAMNQKDIYGDSELPTLNPLREATFAYGNYHEYNRYFSNFGFYQGYKIAPSIESMYLKLLQQRYLPDIMYGLTDELQLAPKESEQKLGVLRIMRMIEDESGRDKQLVLNYMRNRWSDLFIGQQNKQEQLIQHLDYALTHNQWKKERNSGDKMAIDAFMPFKEPIQQAQIELKKLSIYQRIYQNLRLKSANILPTDLNVKTEIGASFDSVYQVNNEKQLVIPQFLTHESLINYFLKQDESFIDLTALDSWVLGVSKSAKYTHADRDNIKHYIIDLYMNDYINTWHKAYDNLIIKDFDSIANAIETLESINGSEQPLKKAIMLIQNNSEALTVSDLNNKKNNETEFTNEERTLINSIHREFSKAVSVLQDNNQQLSIIQNASQKLGDLHRYLLMIQNSPSPGKAALKAVQLHMNQNSSDPIIEIQQLAKTAPDPLGRWLNELSKQIWDVIITEAIRSLEVEWNDKVVKDFNLNLANRYPFNPSSNQDVPLSEFQRFFKNGGVIDSFYQENLKIFVDNNLLKNAHDKRLIRADVLAQLKIADKIRRTFFDAQNALNVQYTIKPISMSANKRRSILNLDGQLVDYSHGKSIETQIIWPNTMREEIESKLTLISNTNQSSKTLIRSGSWGQFRLFDIGKLTNITESSFDVRYDIDGGSVIYRIQVDSAENPFAGGLFSHFKLSDTLY